LGLLDRFRTRGARNLPQEGDLFDDEFQRKLEYLALVSRRVFAGRMRAERRTKKSGSGIEFADHRDYQPGDDFRYLDWKVYQRFDKLLVRLFEEEEDLAVYFVLDQSGSMGFGAGKKFGYAKKLTAALAYVALANLDRVCIVSGAEKLEERMPDTRGKARIFKVFRFLRELPPSGKTGLKATLRAFVAQHKRRGLVVLVSDFYDPAGFEDAVNVLRYNKFDPLVIHVTDASERTVDVSGDVKLYDCETGEEREVTVTAGVLKKYAQAYDEHRESVERFCKSRTIPYVNADVTIPFDELILRVFRKGGFLR
jgi:uncharacterized protein (DUF58 family)